MAYRHRPVHAPKRALKLARENLEKICECGHWDEPDHTSALGVGQTRCDHCNCPAFASARLKVVGEGEGAQDA